MRGIDPLRTSWVLELMFAMETYGTLVAWSSSSAAEEEREDVDEDEVAADVDDAGDHSRKSVIELNRAARCSSLSQTSATIPTSPLVARASREHCAINSARLRTSNTASPKLM